MNKHVRGWVVAMACVAMTGLATDFAYAQRGGRGGGGGRSGSGTVRSAPAVGRAVPRGAVGGYRGGYRGALVVQNGLRLDGTAGEQTDLLSVLANHAAVAAENFRLYKRLEQLAITDELTRVYNYRFL